MNMCGRYVLYDLETLRLKYGLPPSADTLPNFNAAPTQSMPVITEGGIEMMRWGLIPRWAKDERMGYRLINARSESVFDKPIWKSAVLNRRCLVPANGFYEWQKRPGGKQPFYIHPKDQQLFMFAGIWEAWQHGDREWHTYSILTTAPNKEMTVIHNRMPVILHEEDQAQWLGADSREDLEPLLVPYTNHHLEMFEVSKSVNVVKFNDNRLIMPINSHEIAK